MKNKQATIEKFGTFNEIKIIESPIPEPKTGEVLIRVEASTISSTDITIRKGLYPLLKDNPPFTLGYDFVGIVEKLGEKVTTLSVGDRVADICQIGGNTHYICREAKALLKIDKKIEAIEVAPLILSGMTAYQIFKYYTNLKSGDSFLVHGGSGAVGNILLQLCKIHQVKTISTSSMSKLPILESLGAIAVDYQSENYFETLQQNAKEGFDVAIDFSNQKSINHSFKLLKKGGRMILCGLLTTQKKIERKTFVNFLRFGLEFGEMMLKKTLWNTFSSKKAIFFGIVDSKKDFPERYQKDLNELIELVISGKIKPHIHQIFNLDDTAKVHKCLEDGKSAGHLVISMN
jgi:NADPH:quinone reductase-like Zn-dependent oxidoreductase